MPNPGQNRKKNDSGQVITVAIVAIVIIAIMIPVVIKFVELESRWSVKQKKTTSAFHLGEAGVDRGIWKLTEQDQNWTDAKNGVAVAGYNDDVLYADIEGGEYKIKFSSGPNAGEVTVLSKGRDKSTNEQRSIQAIYTKASINAGLSVEGAMQYDPNMIIHWGPVVTFGSINQSPNDYFPRKYSKGQIVGRDTVDNSDNDGDGTEYVAFSRDLGTAPQIDFEYYKAKAKASIVPITSAGPAGNICKSDVGGNPVAVATPVGSGYFSCTQNGGGLLFKKIGAGAYQFRSSTSVIYIDNDTGVAKTTILNDSFLEVEALILAGNQSLNFNADDFNNFMATMPATANLEYQHADAGTAAAWASFSGAWGGASHCCHEIDGLGFHGFLYSGGTTPNAGGGAKILGAVDFVAGGTWNFNTTTVYYDAAVASGIRLKGGSPRRISWKEVKVAW